MLKKMITFWMACFFLAGSVLLPLGDFSLMRDIPDMYRNYTKITTPEELGIMDFIGDYLLHGKELFGNNAHDKSQNATNNVQFQHQASPLSIVLFITSSSALTFPEISKSHGASKNLMISSDYHQALFRPPLA